MHTGNEIIDELLTNGKPEDESYYRCKYKDVKIDIELYSEQCIIYNSDEDRITIQYNYSRDETKLCLDMLCDIEYFRIMVINVMILIYCNGLITVVCRSNNIFNIESKWISLLPLPIYLKQNRH